MKFQPPRGTKDCLPDEMGKRRWVFDKLRKNFELYGYGEVDTPAFESLELLTCKGSLGDEAIKDVYRLKDKSNRELGLRFDPTTPMARMVASARLPKPIRWYFIGKLWRYEDVAKGRSREFSQAGIELIGAAGAAADAEVIQVTIDCLLAVGLKDFTVRINSRNVLDSAAAELGIKNAEDVFRILDKLDKKGEVAVRDELGKKISQDQVKGLFDFVQGRKKVYSSELDDIIKALGKKYRKFVKQDLSIARGLDYYTGFIFEVNVKGFKDLGAIAAGGRYDSLIKRYGGSDTPATGFGIGIERLMQILEEKKLIGKEEKTTIYVIALGDEAKVAANDVCIKLRENNIITELAVVDRSLTNELKYANSKGMQYSIIIGPKDMKEGKFTLRDMKTGEENKVTIYDLIKQFI